MLLRFYKGAITFESVWSLTIRQFIGLLEQANEIAYMESGKANEPQPLSGKMAAESLKQTFGVKNKDAKTR